MPPPATPANQNAAMNAAYAAAVAQRNQNAGMNAAYAAAVQAQSAARAAAGAATAAAAKYGQYAQAVAAAEQKQKNLAQALKDGTYARHAAALADISRQTAALARQAEALNLIYQRGRFGAFQALARPHLQTLGVAAGVGAAATMGMVRGGFSGTAEWQAFTYQWERLQRQLAAIAIPVFEKIGSVVGRVAGWFERLDGRQQDQLMKVGLLTVGVVALAGAVRMATVVLGAFAGVARAAATVMGASAAASTATAAGGAAAAGAAAVGGLAATGAAGAGRGGLLALGKGALKLALPVALAAGVAEEATDKDGFYEMERRRGTSELGSAFAALGHTALNLVTFGYHAERLRERGELAAPEKSPRRDVTPFGNSLLEAGGTAQLIQQELLRASVARREEAEGPGGTAVVAGLLRDILERIGERDDIRALFRVAER